MTDQRWSAVVGVLAFAGLASSITACGNNGAGKSTASTTKTASPSPNPSQPPSPVTSAGTPQAVNNPNPPVRPSASPSPGGSGGGGSGTAQTWLWYSDQASNADAISALQLDSSGVVTGNPVTTLLNAGDSPQFIAVDSTNAVLVAALFGVNKAQGFAINRATGALTPATAVATQNPSPTGIAIDPQGAFVYTGDGGGTNSALSIFGLTLSSGALAPAAAPSATGTGTGAAGISIDGQGAFLYVADSTSNDIDVFSITNGTATSLGATTTDSGPHMVALHPTKSFVYTPNFGSTTNADVSVFTVSNGVLTPSSTAPNVESTTNGGSAEQAVVDPSGKFLFVTNHFAADFGVLSINQTTGDLTLVGNTTVNASGSTEGIIFHPSLPIVYVSDTTAGTITAFSYSTSTGAVTTPGTTTTLPQGSIPFALAISQ